jgi:site-specific DNA recombinase
MILLNGDQPYSKMKVALYTRVSTEDQATEGTSLEVQENALVAFSKLSNYEVYKVYRDDGYSGYSLDRPALKQLLKDGESKKFNLILVHKIDRLSRNLKDLLFLYDDVLRPYGVDFKSITEPFDTTAAGRLQLQILGTFAEFERNRLKERIFPGMIEGVKRGNWQGARYAPYGYLYNKEKKVLEVVSDEAKVVKMIYLMYLSGQSTPQIAGYLYEKGYKTRSGGKFHTKIVCDILKNKIYLGILIWNTHHYDKNQKTLKGYRYVKNDPSKVVIAEGRHEAIIEQEEFDAVQQKLNHSRKGTLTRNGNQEYLLTGLLVCAHCGHRLQGCLNCATRENKKTKTKRRYYRCSGRQTHYIRCDNKHIRAEDAENVVLAIFETILSDEITEARIKGLVDNNANNYTEDIKHEIEKLKAALNANLDKQSKLSGIYSDGLLALEAYKDQILPLREDENRIRLEIKKNELSVIERERSKEYKKLIELVTGRFKDMDKDMDIVSKKGLLQLVFKAIKVHNGKIIDFELFEPFESLYKGMRIKCQLKENQIVTTIPGSVLRSLHSDVR